jgi:hypothetical protein
LPGTRVSITRKPVDVVLVAARYEGSSSRISLTQAYERRGPIWSDLLLLDREQLIARLRSKKRVFTGRARDMSGDFDVSSAVRLLEAAGASVVRANGRDAPGDDLGLPLF